MTKLLRQSLVGLGYSLAAIGAVLPPAAYALDELDTLPAIALALLLIAMGGGMVVLADRLADSAEEAEPAEQIPPGPPSLSKPRYKA